MFQFRQTGAFNQLADLVFGRLEPSVQQEENEQDNIKRILTDVTNGYSFPVLFNAQFGHLYPSWFIVNGSNVEINGLKVSTRWDPYFD